MFQLTNEEWSDLKCQIGTSSWGGSRVPPYPFAEQGVAILEKCFVTWSQPAVQTKTRKRTTS
jgi:hypothetical protein